MEPKTLHSSWKETAEQILANDIKDVSYGEKEVILQSFLSGAQTFMNMALSCIETIKEDIIESDLLSDANKATTLGAFSLFKNKIKNCEIHLNK